MLAFGAGMERLQCHCGRQTDQDGATWLAMPRPQLQRDSMQRTRVSVEIFAHSVRKNAKLMNLMKRLTRKSQIQNPQ